MEKTITLSAGKIVGIKTSIFTIFNSEKYDPEAIPAAWKEFFSKSSDLPRTQSYYGASIPSMSLDAPMDYFAGALLPIDYETPEGFESVDFPAGEYLAVTHLGPISTIAASYQRAYMESLGASGREMRPAPHLEIYNPDLNPMADDYEMVIAIPVI